MRQKYPRNIDQIILIDNENILYIQNVVLVVAAYVRDLKYYVISRGDFSMKTVSTKLGIFNPLFTTECTGRYRGLSSLLSTDDTRTGHSCEEHFSATFALLGVVESACFRNIRPTARAATFHIAWPQRKSYPRTIYRCTMRGIFDVKVLLLKLLLVCSASNFQTSCF